MWISYLERICKCADEDKNLSSHKNGSVKTAIKYFQSWNEALTIQQKETKGKSEKHATKYLWTSHNLEKPKSPLGNLKELKQIAKNVPLEENSI